MDAMEGEAAVRPVDGPVAHQRATVRMARLVHAGVPALLLLLLAMGVTVGGWWPGRVLAPGETLQQAPPWGKGEAVNPWALGQMTQWVAPMHAAVERLRRGEIPLWNPCQGIGQPLLGTGHAPIFYPTILLHLLGDGGGAWALSAIVRLWVAGWGAWLLARRQRLGTLGAALAAVTFMLGGFQLIGLNATTTNVLCLLPWAVLASVRLWERATTGRVATLAIVAGLAALGGDALALGALLLSSLLVSTLARRPEPCRTGAPAASMSRKHGRRIRATGAVIGAWALAVAIGLLLGGVHWLPVIEQWRQTVALGESAHPAELPWGLALFQSNIASPAFVGVVPFLLAVFALKMSRRRRVVRAWVGVVLVLGLVTLGGLWVPTVWRRGGEMSIGGWGTWLSAATLAIALLAGCGLEALLRQLRGGLQEEGLTDALINVAVAAAAVGGVWGVFWLVRDEPTRWTPVAVRLGVLAVTLAVAAWLWRQGMQRCRVRVEADPFDLSRSSLHVQPPAPALPDPKLVRRIGIAWLLLATAELLAFAIPYEQGMSRPLFPPLAAQPALDASARFAATDGVFPPNLAMAYGVDDLHSAAAASARWAMWQPLLQFHATRRARVVGVDPKPDPAASAPAMTAKPDEPAEPERVGLTHVNDLPLRLLGMRYLLTRADDPTPGGPWHKVQAYENSILYENPPAMPRAWIAREARRLGSPAEVFDQLTAPWNFDPHQVVLVDDDVAAQTRDWLENPPELRRRNRLPDPQAWWRHRGGGQGKASITYLADSPEHRTITVQGSGGGWLVVDDAYAPGWEALLHRQQRQRGREMDIRRPIPLVPAYGVLQAVAIPGGDLTVEMIYRPWGWKYGLFASAAGLLGVLLVVAGGLSAKEQRRRENQENISR
jgi:hypothetical protein